MTNLQFRPLLPWFGEIPDLRMGGSRKLLWWLSILNLTEAMGPVLCGRFKSSERSFNIKILLVCASQFCSFVNTLSLLCSSTRLEFPWR